MLAIRLPLAAALLAHLTCPTDAAPQWRESHGGPDGSYCAAGVVGPRTAPVERWREEFDELLCEPVVHAGHVAVVARSRRVVQLVVMDLEDGDVVLRKRVRAGASAAISFDEVYLCVATDEEFMGGEFRRGRFRRTFGERGASAPLLSTSGPIAAVAFEEKTHVYDMRSGDLLGDTEQTFAKPIATPGEGRTIARFHILEESKFLRGSGRAIREIEITRDGDDGLRFATRPTGVSREAAGAARPPEPFMRIGEGEQRFPVVMASVDSEGKWVHILPTPGDVRVYREIPLEDRGVVHDGWLIGRIEGENVISITDDRTKSVGANRIGWDDPAAFRFLVDDEHRPEAAVDGPMSVAGDVLLLGNWAIDATNSRVLWVAPDLDIGGRAIPAGDGVIVYRSGDGALVCAAADPTAAAGGEVAQELPSEGAPGDGAAIVLRDGRRLAGEATWEGERYVLGGDGDSFAPFAVAAVEDGEGLTEVRYPYAVLRAAERALARALASDLVETAGESAERGLLENARRLLAEAERLGGDRDGIAEVENVIATKREITTATREVKLERVLEIEAEARAAARARRAERATWIGAQGLTIQASALVARHWVDDGEEGPPRRVPREIHELLETVAPDVKRIHAGRWLEACAAYAPANAREATDEEAESFDPQTDAWERCTLIVTEHIMLAATEKRLDVLAGVLLFGETTIQALDEILGADPEDVDQRFDVRLHASQFGYLGENVDGEALAPGWSAGFYNELVRTSRFFVPDVDPSRYERDLYKTVAHELTHQYIAERWYRRVDTERRSPKSPGFWIVEGFARFIEDQSVEMSRLGLGFDDATVDSIEVTAALLEADEFVPMDEFLSLRQLDLQRLSMEEEKTLVHLTNERVSYEVDALGGFYAQAGALAFFMMNHAGEEGPARLVDALAAHYSGETEREGWVALGFDSAEALEAEFTAFLRASAAR